MRSIGTRLLAVFTLASVLALPLDALSQNSPFPISTSAQLQNAAVATGNGTAMPVNQMQVATIQVSGTFTATVSFQGSSDGTNYQALTCYTLDSSTSATSASAAGIWRCNVGGLQLIRTPVTWSSGTSVTVWATASSAAGPIRDVTSASGAITGQLRGTQTTLPTCATLNGAGTVSATSCVIDSATDSFIRGHVASGLAVSGAASTSAVVRVTFNGTFASIPACTAAKDTKYGYYIYAVTPTTTTVDVKIDAQAGWVTPAASVPIWVAQDLFSVICAGTQ